LRRTVARCERQCVHSQRGAGLVAQNLRWSALLVVGIALVATGGLHLLTQTIHYAKLANPKNGEAIYRAGCIACHGSMGKGAPESATVFKRPDTFPDFTDCAGTTPEPNGNWKAAIVHGGPSRGLSQIMPAFGDLLTDEQIN